MNEIEKLTGDVVNHRITPETDLPPMRFLFTFNGTPCFPVCELVAGTGKAKSGKTLFMSMIMACALSEEQLVLRRQGSEPLRVLWFDTEQSEQSTQDILKNRIMKMVGNDKVINDYFYAVNVRGMGYVMRRDMLLAAIIAYKPTLVILDGIKDLMLDINDAKQATETAELLMAWAQRFECCIVSVLHQNKSEADHNMRGSIGTELSNKAFEVFSCAISEEDDQVFVVTHSLSRKDRSRMKLFYSLDKDAMPVMCNNPNDQPRDAHGRYMVRSCNLFNRKYIENPDEKDPAKVVWRLHHLFNDAIGSSGTMTRESLRARVMKLANIKVAGFYDKLFKLALEQHVIEERLTGIALAAF